MWTMNCITWRFVSHGSPDVHFSCNNQEFVCDLYASNRWQLVLRARSTTPLIRSAFHWLKWATSWQNQQNGMCVQRRLRSAWASAQSDQGLRCPHEEILGPSLPIERTVKTDQTGRMPRLIWVFAGCTCHFVGFVVRWLKWLWRTYWRRELVKIRERDKMGIWW